MQSNNLKITPSNIQQLKHNQIFVFGSNLAGIHGAGAAKTALKWGAKWKQGIGLAGNTYALPTKDQHIIKLSISEIEKYVLMFISFAIKHPELEFLVTSIGCGLAGYTAKDIAPLFKPAIALNNIYLPSSFWTVLNEIKSNSKK